MIEYKECEKMIKAVLKKHEADLGNMKTVAKQQAVEFFKIKALENNKYYQRDMSKFLAEYDDLKLKYFFREKKIS
jgi:hypothetical protein